LAACRSGDTLVVTKARPARAVAARCPRHPRRPHHARGQALSIGGSVHDPTGPVGRLLFNVLAMVAEFESDLIRLRTKEGMRVAKAKGHLRGRPPKLTPRQETHLVTLYRAGQHSTAQHRRAQRLVRRRALDRVPRHRARRPAPQPRERFVCGKPRWIVDRKQPTPRVRGGRRSSTVDGDALVPHVR
jgi:hypothetical protein